MARITTCVGLLLLCFAMSISAAAQSSAATAPAAPAATTDTPAATQASKGARIQNFNEVKEANPPDMVCFGYGPKWSIQFTNGAARYLGVNQPDQDFLGAFYWDSDMKVWNWHREDDLAPMNGSFALSGTISKASCHDRIRGETYPYSAQVNLPQGDMVSGCCRKLKPGEAVVGKHGLQQTAATPNVPAPTGSATAPASAPQPNSQQSNSTAPSTKKSRAGIPQPMPQ
jgi:uncharacterized membrane protein